MYPIDINPQSMKQLEDFLDLDDITDNKGIGDPSTVDLHFEDWDTQEKMIANICDMDILKLVAKALKTKPEYLSFAGTDLFCKKRSISKDDESAGFVGWHQDQSWWKLKPNYAFVSLWIAFDDVSAENGAVKFIIDPQYIKEQQIFEHEEKIENNDLQYSIKINETSYQEKDQIVTVELKKNQGMLFSGLAIHGSLPNYSDKRRCGIVFRFTIQSYRDEIPIEKIGEIEPRKLRDGSPYIVMPFDILDRCTNLKLFSNEKDKKDEL